MNGVMISVIVSIYNISEYLTECIESIISQTYKNLQIILVDDGSTDNSGVICDNYKKYDDRILVIHKNNEGLVSSRKEGLKRAKGQYVSFIDGDDFLDVNMYEEMLEVACVTDCDIVNTGMKVDGYSKMLSPNFNLSVGHYNAINILSKYVLSLNPNYSVSHNLCNKLIKTELIKKCYSLVPDGQAFGEDWLGFSACICEGVNLISMNKTYYNYRVRGESISHKYSSDIYLQVYGLYNSFLSLFKYYGIHEDLKENMNQVLRYSIIDALKKDKRNTVTLKYKFPLINKIRNKKIIVYGAGTVGEDYYVDLSRYQDIQIVAWIDKKYSEKHFDFYDVKPIEAIRELDYDYIIIANLDINMLQVIKTELHNWGIQNNKIVNVEPVLI